LYNRLEYKLYNSTARTWHGKRVIKRLGKEGTYCVGKRAEKIERRIKAVVPGCASEPKRGGNSVLFYLYTGYRGEGNTLRGGPINKEVSERETNPLQIKGVDQLFSTNNHFDRFRSKG